VEKLFRLRWSPADGVGAIVISPTRELAMQIFDTLRCAPLLPQALPQKAAADNAAARRKFAKNHSFSAGLLIGGKDVDYEKEKVTSAHSRRKQTLPEQP
jgi:ATP-dependent RNA helicase DDX10/DBP4